MLGLTQLDAVQGARAEWGKLYTYTAMTFGDVRQRNAPTEEVLVAK